MSAIQVSKLDPEKDIEIISSALNDVNHPLRAGIINKLSYTVCYGYNSALLYLKKVDAYLKVKDGEGFSGENWFLLGFIFSKQR